MKFFILICMHTSEDIASVPRLQIMCMCLAELFRVRSEKV